MAEVMSKAELIGVRGKAGVIPRNAGVQARLQAEAEAIHAKAQGLMASHHQTNNAHLGVERGRVDRYVYLADPPAASSPGAAMSIEFGHAQYFPGIGPAGFTPGLFILHDASGYPRRA